MTNGPERTVSSKCFKSLELLKKSLQKMEDNIKELSTFNIQLNLEAWAAAYYTHLALYYKLPSTSAVTLPKISIPKPAVLQVLTRNEEASMRSWAKKHGKSVRQRNVRQDNTKDRAGTLPLNLYESVTILNPLHLQLVTTGVQPDIIESLDNEVREEHTRYRAA